MEIILRATAVYLFVYLVIRVMGKRELGEMSAFELILLVMIGDVVQQAVTQEDYSVTGAVLAVGTIAFWAVVSSYASFRWNRARRVLESPPIVVIDKGRVQHEILHTERVDEDELKAAARRQGIRDLRDIDLAVLESDGKFSFLQRIGAARPEPDEHIATH
jgi:uncharacterized membrane protein YcaP (DUF421 family)